MEKIELIVQKYIGDEKKCLEDWYSSQYGAKVYPGKPVLALPSLEEIRTAFNKWVNQKREQFFNLICVEWDYPTKRKDQEFQDKAVLITSLADFLISQSWNIPCPIAVSVLLFQKGLDEFCCT